MAMEPLSARAARSALASYVRLSSMLGTSPPPTNDRGDVLDPDVHAFLALLARRGKFDPRRPVGDARREYDTVGPVTDLPRRPLARIESLTIEGAAGPLRARLYAPRAGREPMRGIVWLHGGGFVIGSLRSHDHAMRAIADDADAVVVAIDYRLGPEHHFPAAHDDALAAFRWVWREAAGLGIDRARLAIGGDSAGANLATSTCLALRDRKEPLPALEVLVYPTTDIGGRTASKDLLGENYFLTQVVMDWFMERYVRDHGDDVDPRLSVLRAELAGIPPAIVSTAGFDPLRDEGDAYAAALAKAGVKVERRPEPRLIHGWLTMGGVIPEAARAVRSLAVAVKSALG
jgi:acetyl esterase